MIFWIFHYFSFIHDWTKIDEIVDFDDLFFMWFIFWVGFDVFTIPDFFDVLNLVVTFSNRNQFGSEVETVLAKCRWLKKMSISLKTLTFVVDEKIISKCFKKIEFKFWNVIDLFDNCRVFLFFVKNENVDTFSNDVISVWIVSNCWIVSKLFRIDCVSFLNSSSRFFWFVSFKILFLFVIFGSVDDSKQLIWLNEFEFVSE